MTVSDDNTAAIICSVVNWFNVMNILCSSLKTSMLLAVLSVKKPVQVLDISVCILRTFPQNILDHTYFNLE